MGPRGAVMVQSGDTPSGSSQSRTSSRAPTPAPSFLDAVLTNSPALDFEAAPDLQLEDLQGLGSLPSSLPYGLQATAQISSAPVPPCQPIAPQNPYQHPPASWGIGEPYGGLQHQQQQQLAYQQQQLPHYQQLPLPPPAWHEQLPCGAAPFVPAPITVGRPVSDPKLLQQQAAAHSAQQAQLCSPEQARTDCPLDNCSVSAGGGFTGASGAAAGTCTGSHSCSPQQPTDVPVSPFEAATAVPAISPHPAAGWNGVFSKDSGSSSQDGSHASWCSPLDVPHSSRGGASSLGMSSLSSGLSRDGGVGSPAVPGSASAASPGSVPAAASQRQQRHAAQAKVSAAPGARAPGVGPKAGWRGGRRRGPATMSPNPPAPPATAEDDAVAKALRKQKLLQEKNRRAQANARRRKKASGLYMSEMSGHVARLVCTSLFKHSVRCKCPLRKNPIALPALPCYHDTDAA